MEYITEVFYNILEAVLITGFFSVYFSSKAKFGKVPCIVITFALIFTANTLLTFFSAEWILTILIVVSLFFVILSVFYKGSVMEKLLVSFVVNSLIALINVSTFTIMSKVFGTEYSQLVEHNSTMRFMTVMITKVIFLIALSIVSFWKRKKLLLLNKAEYTMLSTTLLVSGILIIIVRNIIYKSESNYSAFLVIIFCMLMLIVGQYYMMLYISKKNMAEQKLSVMKKQMEMQEENIRLLEKSQNATSELRHDMNNYILCALEMAEKSEYAELTEYLKNLSKARVNSVKYYIHADRKVISAVINTKFAVAEENGVKTKCAILDEMKNIMDVDVAILLANLLDNSIEACAKNKGDSEITLKIWSDAGYYCIEIVNTVENDILKYNPELVTSKADKNLHGIGLQTVRDIVAKYDGMISFVQKGNNFHVCISLSRDEN